MDHIDADQIYHILKNLSDLEISYMEYSYKPKDFVKYTTFLEYFNNYVIKNNKLSLFYFPASPEQINPANLSALPEIIDEKLVILPNQNISMAKHFNFPVNLIHSCNYFSCVYMIQGAGKLEVNSDIYELASGDFVIIPPEIKYSLNTTFESICVYIDLRKSFIASEYKVLFHGDPFITKFIANSLSLPQDMTHLIIHTADEERLRRLVLTIFAEYINQDKHCNDVMRDYFSLFIAYILRSSETKYESSIKLSRVEEQFQDIIDYLMQNYKIATLTTVANELHISKQYVCKIVKQQSGNTFNQTLMEIRLDMAKQYLKETELNLETISELCGFSSSSHLSRVFKNKYNSTPSNFRKKQNS
ncbi:MAG: AraC family transcriptional regulator [Anaerostipes sp.]|nr:AraC family transcriptional regulator [Anaerostipes sp.]MDD3503735.1 AraC family transcriptional regulator [Eubacteriales bacterium]